MREDGQHGQQVPGEMAAGVAQKCPGAGEVVRQKTSECARHQERHRCHEILARHRSQDSEYVRGDYPEAGA